MADQKKRPPDEDEAQSKRFIEAVRQIEADGGLSREEAEQALDKLIESTVPQRKP